MKLNLAKLDTAHFLLLSEMADTARHCLRHDLIKRELESLAEYRNNFQAPFRFRDMHDGMFSAYESAFVIPNLIADLKSGFVDAITDPFDFWISRQCVFSII